MEILKSTNKAPDFCLVSKRANVNLLSCLPIGATRKPGKKISCMVDFIVSMALTMKLLAGVSVWEISKIEGRGII